MIITISHMHEGEDLNGRLHAQWVFQYSHKAAC